MRPSRRAAPRATPAPHGGIRREPRGPPRRRPRAAAGRAGGRPLGGPGKGRRATAGRGQPCSPRVLTKEGLDRLTWLVRTVTSPGSPRLSSPNRESRWANFHRRSPVFRRGASLNAAARARRRLKALPSQVAGRTSRRGGLSGERRQRDRHERRDDERDGAPVAPHPSVRAQRAGAWRPGRRRRMWAPGVTPPAFWRTWVVAGARGRPLAGGAGWSAPADESQKLPLRTVFPAPSVTMTGPIEQTGSTPAG